MNWANELATVLNGHAIKFYTFVVTVLVLLGRQAKKWHDSREAEKSALVERVEQLEKSQQEVITRIDRIDTHMEEDRLERKDMHKKLDTIVELMTDVRIQTEVNSTRLEERNKKG